MTEMIFNQAQRCRERYQTSDPYELLDAMGVILMIIIAVLSAIQFKLGQSDS